MPKHEHLGTTSVPLIQWVPPAPLNDTYPPTMADGHNLAGGGPIGGQIGLPSYFMPGEDFNPMWHIGFAHWLTPAEEVVKSLDRVKELRAEGKVEIMEWPAINVNSSDPEVSNGYLFTNPNPPHIVNCPTPVTLDTAVHRAVFIE